MIVDERNLVKRPPTVLPPPAPRPDKRLASSQFEMSPRLLTFSMSVVGTFNMQQLQALVNAVRTASATQVEIPIANFVRAVLNLVHTTVCLVDYCFMCVCVTPSSLLVIVA